MKCDRVELGPGENDVTWKRQDVSVSLEMRESEAELVGEECPVEEALDEAVASPGSVVTKSAVCGICHNFVECTATMGKTKLEE